VPAITFLFPVLCLFPRSVQSMLWIFHTKISDDLFSSLFLQVAIFCCVSRLFQRFFSHESLLPTDFSIFLSALPRCLPSLRRGAVPWLVFRALFFLTPPSMRPRRSPRNIPPSIRNISQKDSPSTAFLRRPTLQDSRSPSAGCRLCTIFLSFSLLLSLG